MRFHLRPGLDRNWIPGLLGPEGQEGGWGSGTLPDLPVCFMLQRRAPENDCLGDLSRYYDKADGKCCHRCREGEWGLRGWGRGEFCPQATTVWGDWLVGTTRVNIVIVLDCRFLKAVPLRVFLFNDCVHAKLLQCCPTQGPSGLSLTSFLCPWDSPGKNTGVACHALL